MRKLLILIFVTIISFNTFSQTRILTIKNTIGIFNEYTGEFDLEDFHYANITFSFYREYISVDDDAHSIYRIIKHLPKEYFSNYNMTITECLDEKNRNCRVALIKYNDGSFSIDVIYNGKAFIYIVK